MEQGMVPFLMPYLDEYLPNLSREYDMPKGSAKVLSPLMEFLGARTNPKYPWAIVEETDNKNLYGMPEEWLQQWYSEEEWPSVLQAFRDKELTSRHLPKLALADLRKKFADSQQAYEAAVEDSAVRDTDEWREWTSRIDTEREYLNADLERALEQYRTGQLTPYEWRTKVADAYDAYSARADMIENDERYTKIYETLNKSGLDENSSMMDLALAEYQGILYADYDDPATGEVDWDERDRLLYEFEEKWGAGVVQKLDAYLADKAAQKGTPEFNLAKSAAMDKLDEAYWDMETSARNEYRTANPEIDAALLLYGYGGRVQTEAAYRIAMDAALGFGFTDDALAKLGLPPKVLASDYFGYIALSGEHGGSSLEAKYYRLDHPAFDEWGQEAYGWQPIDSEGMMSLEVRDLWEKYAALEGAKERLVFRHENPELENYLVNEKGYKPVGDRWE
jgi:hypothetical protein